MTNAEARFSNSLRPQKPEGSLGRTAQDGHLNSDVHQVAEVSHNVSVVVIKARCTSVLELNIPFEHLDHTNNRLACTSVLKVNIPLEHFGNTNNRQQLMLKNKQNKERVLSL